MEYLISFLFFNKVFFSEKQNVDYSYLSNQVNVGISFFIEEKEYYDKHHYNGESSDVIAQKLERSFNSNLSGEGKFITEYCIEIGMDPYLASAVMLLETGCKWTCSYAARNYNNYGGNYCGNKLCRFSSKEEGIKHVIDNLYYGYYSKGATTPEAINKRYATSKTWASKVNNYIWELKRDL